MISSRILPHVDFNHHLIFYKWYRLWISDICLLIYLHHCYLHNNYVRMCVDFIVKLKNTTKRDKLLLCVMPQLSPIKLIYSVRCRHMMAHYIASHYVGCVWQWSHSNNLWIITEPDDFSFCLYNFSERCGDLQSNNTNNAYDQFFFSSWALCDTEGH